VRYLADFYLANQDELTLPKEAGTIITMAGIVGDTGASYILQPPPAYNENSS